MHLPIWPVAFRRLPLLMLVTLVGTVIVVGVGGQGLVMLLALMECGVEVSVQDVNPDRVAFAVDLGAWSVKLAE